METAALFEEKIPITPRDLSRDAINIDELLLKKIATKLEGKCSLHGWVKPSSMKILSRSMGYVEKGRFTGDIVYHLQAEGQVINPPSGALVTGDVIRKNKMGMYVNYNDAIRIILPRDLHLGDEVYDNIDIGERVNVEIKKSRFQVNDEYILSVGLFQGRVGQEGSYRGENPADTYVVESDTDNEEEAVAAPVVPEPVAEPVAAPEPVAEVEEDVVEDTNTTPIEFSSKISENQEFNNTFVAPFTLDGKEWKTAEHYFQAMKFPSDPAYQEEIRTAATAAKAKTLGSTTEKVVRPDWDTYKEEVMKKVLKAKFTDPKNKALLDKLLATGNRPLVEANTADSYWGYGRTKKGKNRMGILLMELRSALRAERKAA